MFRYLKNKIALLDIHTKEVAKKSFTSIIVKAIGMLAGLLLTVMLGRTLGAEGLGIISLANQIIAILLIFCFLGTNQILIKEISISFDNKELGRISDIIRSSIKLIGTISLIVAIIIISARKRISFSFFNEPQLIQPLTLFCLALVPQMISRILSAGLIGYRKIWQSNLVDQALSTLITLLIFAFLYFINKITILSIAFAYIIGRVLVTIIVGSYWKNIHPYKGEGKNLLQVLVKPAIPLYVATLSTVINANSSIIILGLFEDAKQIGLFTVASRVALLTSFFLQITISALAPNISTLYKKKDIESLRNMIQRTTLGLFIIGLMSFIIFSISGKYILGIWGEDFKSAYAILIIISIGQLLNISTGPAGLILTMCGFEKTIGNISIISLIVSLLLNIIFISVWGITGAAIAMATTIIFDNIAKLVYAYKKTGIWTLKLNFK